MANLKKGAAKAASGNAAPPAAAAPTSKKQGKMKAKKRAATEEPLAPAPAKALVLGFESDAEDDGGQGEKLVVNAAYAARFEHNKQREELHRLEAKHGPMTVTGDGDDDDDDYDSTDELDADDGVLPAPEEAKFAALLHGLRSRDPQLYKPGVAIFDGGDDSSDDGDDGGGDAPAAREKPVFLRQALAEQLLEGGDDDDDDAPPARAPRHTEPTGPKAYDDEQRELRAAFLATAADADGGEGDGDDGGGGGILKLRPRTAAERRAEAAAAEDDAAGDGGAAAAAAAAHLEAYFGADDTLDPDERFLKSYITTRGWLDPAGGDGDDGDGDDGDGGGAAVSAFDAEEAELDREENYEAAFNFRYQEPGGAAVTGHARVVDGAIRKTSDTRKQARVRRTQRESAAADAARAELTRLKSLKRAEVDRRLALVAQVAGSVGTTTTTIMNGGGGGGGAPTWSALDLESEWDPAAHDARMSTLFGDGYYASGDGDDEAALAAAMEGDEGEDDDDQGGDGFGAARARAQAAAAGATAGGDDQAGNAGVGDDGNADDGVGVAQGGKRAAKRARAAAAAALEEYYKLDCEGFAGGRPTRFHYRSVEPRKFGLSAAAVLAGDDRDLNRIISLKALAPYRDDARGGGRKFYPGARKEKPEVARRGGPGVRGPKDAAAARAASFIAPSAARKRPAAAAATVGPPSKKTARPTPEGAGGDGGASAADGDPAGAAGRSKSQKKNEMRRKKRAAAPGRP